MRALVIVALCAAPATAFADRTATFELGITGDVRQTGASYGDGPMSTLAGAQLLVGFEHAPIAIPPPGGIDAEVRLVPELLVGFVSDTSHAEGYAGAGLRGELQLGSHRRVQPVRMAMYVAARAMLIGGVDDGALGAAIGEYINLSRGHRFGWEAATMLRPRADGDPGAREVDQLITLYYGWR